MKNRQAMLQAIQTGINPANWQGKVIVVGAGAAGLAAAQILHKSGVEVQILEATERFGGRISTLFGFAESFIELGAEFVHGKKSIWYDLIKHLKRPTISYPDEFDEYYWLDNQLVKESDLEHDDDFQRAIELMDEMYEYEGEDISVRAFIEQTGLRPAVQALLEAWLSTEYGTDTEHISLKTLTESAEQWSAGYDTLILKEDSCLQILEESFKEVLPLIQYQKPVQKIDYSGEKVQLITENNEIFEADKVILTVSIGVLQANLIAFAPPLPETKQAAIAKIGMDAGMKVILKFKERFWDEYLGEIYGGKLVQDYYTSAKTDEAILTAYIMGSRARYLSQNKTEIPNLLLEELCEIFGNRMPNVHFEDCYVMDWLSEPYIRGAYSYPSADADKMRSVLAESIEQKLYFAGEAATTLGHPATVQGAIESACSAVFELLGIAESSN
jgi:monoamine oxidase